MYLFANTLSKLSYANDSAIATTKVTCFSTDGAGTRLEELCMINLRSLG